MGARWFLPWATAMRRSKIILWRIFLYQKCLHESNLHLMIHVLQYNHLMSCFTNSWNSLRRQLLSWEQTQTKCPLFASQAVPTLSQKHCHRLNLQLWFWPLSFPDSKIISKYFRPLQTMGFGESILKPLPVQKCGHWEKKEGILGWIAAQYESQK